jgi:hypothetical protein
MPPKGKPAASSATQKSIEDKTFGMKNKKSGKMNKYIQQLEAQASGNARREVYLSSFFG